MFFSQKKQTLNNLLKGIGGVLFNRMPMNTCKRKYRGKYLCAVDYKGSMILFTVQGKQKNKNLKTAIM